MLACLALIAYFASYFTITRAYSPTWEVETADGRKTVFCILPGLKPRYYADGKFYILRYRHPLEVGCYYFFYPLLMLDGCWGQRYHQEWLYHVNSASGSPDLYIAVPWVDHW